MTIVIAIFTFLVVCGLVSIDNKLEVMIRHQNEIIKLLKNLKK